MEIIVKCEDTLLNYLYSHLDMSKKKVKEYILKFLLIQKVKILLFFPFLFFMKTKILLL